MSKFFIHRPIFAIVISLLIVIIGVLAAVQLPIAQYPQISPPTISVSTTYVGANAKTVNETVAQVIEQQVNGTQGMDYMSSTAASLFLMFWASSITSTCHFCFFSMSASERTTPYVERMMSAFLQSSSFRSRAVP